MDLIIIRLVFISVVAVACYHLKPFGLANFPSWISACAGAVIGAIIVWFEARLRVVSLKRLIGAVIGSIFGILGAYLFSVVIKNSIRILKRSVSSSDGDALDVLCGPDCGSE